MTWSRAAAKVDPRVCLIVSSEGASGVAKRFLFCLLELLDAFLLDILVSLSLDLSQVNHGAAKASRGRHGTEGGGVDVDKINWSS